MFTKAGLVIPAALIEDRPKSQVARDYVVSQSWISPGAGFEGVGPFPPGLSDGAGMFPEVANDDKPQSVTWKA